MQLRLDAEAPTTTAAIVVSELMYAPTLGGAFEFIELLNLGPTRVDLSGFHFDGIDFRFPDGTLAEPGDRLVMAPNDDPAAWRRAYPGVRIAGVYKGRLANEGETLTLMDAGGEIVSRLTYGPGGFWPHAAAVEGYSMEFVGPGENPNDPANWRASLRPGGTPGTGPEAVAPTRMALNEIYAGSAGAGFVEVQSLATETVALDGWSLSDDGDQPRQVVLQPGRLLAPDAASAVYADSIPSGDLHALLARLGEHGGTLGLYDPSGSRVDCVSFTALGSVHSLARWQATWSPAFPTPDAQNSPIVTGSSEALRLNEWSANPTPGQADWPEIYNADPTRVVVLKDVRFKIAGQQFPPPPHAWVEPLGFLVLPCDRAAHPLGLQTRLMAAGGSLALLRSNLSTLHSVDYGPQPEGTSAGAYPDGSIDTIRYLPWPTPGGSNHTDNDADGFPDAWERLQGMDPNNPLEPTQDSDQDGLSDRQELAIGSDPFDPASGPRLQVGIESNELRLTFTPTAQRSYSVLHRARINGVWEKFTDAFVGLNSDPIILRQDLNGDPQHFFALATPAVRLPGESAVAGVIPSDGAREVEPAAAIELTFRSPVVMDTLTASRIRVRNPEGHTVAGRIRVGPDARWVHFEPATPLTAATRFTIEIAAELLEDTLNSSAPAMVTAFTTRPAAPLHDDPRLYTDDTAGLYRLRLTTQPVPGGFSLADLNALVLPQDPIQPSIPVSLVEESAGTPLTRSTGLMRQRGQSARESLQKSFRIDLDHSSPGWRGLRTINLNKHPYDLTRLRNRLSFDLLRTLPHVVGLRSWFVEVSIDASPYGAFTLIEQPGSEFLRAHGLDPEGHLYKASLFEFGRSPAELRAQTAPDYNRKAFETRLEIFGKADHTKLLAMLDDVNEPALPIDTVIERHFNRDNYLEWLAAVILMDNKDTTSQNFFLYSPSTSSTWYFIPWDFDGAWGFYDQPDQAAAPSLPSWRRGIANWWPSVLHQRFLRNPTDLEALRERVADLAAHALSPSIVSNLVQELAQSLQPAVLSPPDLPKLPTLGTADPAEQYGSELRRLPGLVESNRVAFETSIDLPMPVFLGEVVSSGATHTFRWTESFHLRRQPIHYELQLGRDPGFAPGSIEYAADELHATVHTLERVLAPGIWFWRVIVRESDRPATHWQIAFDSDADPATGTVHYGVRRFNVAPPGNGAKSK